MKHANVRCWYPHGGDKRALSSGMWRHSHRLRVHQRCRRPYCFRLQSLHSWYFFGLIFDLDNKCSITLGLRTKKQRNQHGHSIPVCIGIRSRDSAVLIATGHELDDREVGVRVPVVSRIFSSLRRPNRFWGPPNPLSDGYWGKAAGEWNWPLSSNQCWGQENVDLYTHSHIRLHGVVLN
jgi:hypothetical protein